MVHVVFEDEAEDEDEADGAFWCFSHKL